MHARIPVLIARSLWIGGVMALLCAAPAQGQVTQQGVIQANPGVILPGPQPIRPTDIGTPLMQPAEEVILDVEAPPEAIRVEMPVSEFYVADIRLEGNLAIPDEELAPMVAPYENRTITLEELNELVAKITQEYRDRGYLSSMAYITPQSVSDQDLTIRILEGRIGQVAVSGNKYFKAKVVANQLEQRHGDVLNLRALEEDLVRTNRLQDNYRVRAALTAGRQTGETDLTLEVEERQPWQVGLTFDNLGRPFIGQLRWGVDVTNRSLTGRGDRLNARWIMATGTQVALASYFTPINDWGTEVGGSFGFSHVDVDLDMANQPQLTGNAFNYGASIIHPLNRDRTWKADLGLNFRDVNTYIDEERDTEVNIRSLTTGITYDDFDRWGRTFARVQNTFAPQWMGANVDFWKGESFLTRVFNLPRNQAIILSAYGQYTPNDLPPIEQIQLGGFGSVRGYTQGLLLGDRGYQVSAEYRYPIPGLSALSPWLAERLQGALFVDFGQAWLDKDNRYYLAGVSNTGARTTLLGAGVGLRGYLTRFMQGFVDVGFGLLDRDDVEPKGQPVARVHFGIRSDLLPQNFERRSEEITVLEPIEDLQKPFGRMSLNP